MPWPVARKTLSVFAKPILVKSHS